MFYFSRSEAQHNDARGHFLNRQQPETLPNSIPRYPGGFADHYARGDGRTEAFGAVLGVGLFVGAVCLLTGVFDPDRSSRKRPANQTRVNEWKREYVSVRDGWRCTYCGRRVTRSSRHIDHSCSRANGGTNHLNNLRLACRPCNLSKGALNSRDFLC